MCKSLEELLNFALELRVNCRIVDLTRNVELSLFCCLTPFTHPVILDVISLSFVFDNFLFWCGFIEHSSTCSSELFFFPFLLA